MGGGGNSHTIPAHRRLSVPPRTTSATTSPPLVLDGEGMTSCHPLRPSLQTAPLQERSLRLLLRLEALAHELPAVVTMEVLGRRLVVACLHLLALPRVLPVGRLTVLRRLLCLAALVLMGLAVPLEAIGHELLADVAGQLLLVSRGQPDDQQDPNERSERCVHGVLPSWWLW